MIFDTSISKRRQVMYFSVYFHFLTLIQIAETYDNTYVSLYQ